MIRAAVHGVSMDMAMLQRSNAIHISIMAERGTMDDLRLMYRHVSCLAPIRLDLLAVPEPDWQSMKVETWHMQPNILHVVGAD